ncbi:hypothetical protein BHE74_00054018, partial [Ensete ventricosum]
SSFSQKDALALFPHPHCAATTPAQATTTLARRHPPCLGAGAVAFATGVVPAGSTSMGAAPASTPVSSRSYKRQLLPASGLPTGVVLAGVAPTGWPRAIARLRQPLLSTSHGLAADWPWSTAFVGCPGRSRLPLKGAWPWPPVPFPRYVCCKNIARMRRTIIRDSISLHEFKTNLLHENLSSDITIGKPQQEHHMRSEN